MNAIAGVCIEETTLQEEYKAVLADWSAIRAKHPVYSSAPEVAEATKRLDEIERKLKNHRTEHGC